MEISYKEAVKMRKRMKPIPGFPRYGIYNGKVWIAFPEAYMKRTVGNLITNGRKSRLVHLFEDKKI